MAKKPKKAKKSVKKSKSKKSLAARVAALEEKVNMLMNPQTADPTTMATTGGTGDNQT